MYGDGFDGTVRNHSMARVDVNDRGCEVFRYEMLPKGVYERRLIPTSSPRVMQIADAMKDDGTILVVTPSRWFGRACALASVGVSVWRLEGKTLVCAVERGRCDLLAVFQDARIASIGVLIESEDGREEARKVSEQSCPSQEAYDATKKVDGGELRSFTFRRRAHRVSERGRNLKITENVSFTSSHARTHECTRITPQIGCCQVWISSRG